MFEYEYIIRPDPLAPTQAIILVPLDPVMRREVRNQELAEALLDVLNDSGFVAAVHVLPLHVVSVIDVTFHAPKDGQKPSIMGQFRLPSSDSSLHDEIQNIAAQAQKFLTRRMGEAVDAFEMVLAVSTVNPYNTRLRALMPFAHEGHTHALDMEGP